MADNKYEILLGVKLDTSNLSTQINNIKTDSVKINIDTNHTEKQINIIKSQIQSLSNVKVNLGNVNISGINKIGSNIKQGLEGQIELGISGLESTVKQTGKKIGNALENSVKDNINLDGIIDKEVNDLMRSYGIQGKNAFNEIKGAIVECLKEIDSFGEAFTSINKVTDALIDNMNAVKQTSIEQQELRSYIQSANRNTKIHLPQSIASEYGDNYRHMRNSLGNAFTSGPGQDFEGWISELNEKLGQTIDLSHGAEAAFGELYHKYQLAKGKPSILEGNNLGYNFNNKLDSVGLSKNDVRDMQQEIESAINRIDISKKNALNIEIPPIDTSNLEKAESELNDVKNRIVEIDKEIDKCFSDIINVGIESQKYAQQMKDAGYILSEDEIRDAEAKAIEYNQDKINRLEEEKAVLQSKIPVLEDVYNKEKQLIDEVNKQRKLSEQETANINKSIPDNLNFDGTINSLKEFDITVKTSEDAVENLKKELASIGFDETSINNITKDIDELGITVKNVKGTLSKDGSIKFTVSGVDDAQRAIKVIKAFDADGEPVRFDVEFSQNFNEVDKNFAKLKLQAKEISNLKVKIHGLDENSDRFRRLSNQLNECESEYNELLSATKKNLDTEQLAELDRIAKKTANSIDDLDGKFADIQRKQASDIVKKSGKNGQYTREVQEIENFYRRLSNKNFETEQAVNKVKKALIDMQEAATDNDRIEAEKRYQNALQETQNILKRNKETQDNEVAATALKQAKSKLSFEMDNWLKDNSAATKQFGARIRELQNQIEACDKQSLGRLRAEFANIKKEAQLAGKTTLTLGDRLKNQFAKYSSYLSVASVFMYAEQALRDMFEQVKAIDAQMTELKKVTNETDKTYNQFLSNASERAKELGTTIDGLVSSTADFARLGYGFEDATQLAEVANIYSIVGDEIESVEAGTESLISTLAAFKDQAGDMSSGDFAMDIIDKFNEVSNNYAISSGGIGEALKRSASSMSAANNTLDESIALMTAANTVVVVPRHYGNMVA